MNTSSMSGGTVLANPRTPVRFDVCIDTLMNGCVNSFVQLFTLSHRDPVCVDELAQTMFSVPDERLEWLQERLVTAELKRRRGDFKGVYSEFLSLACYFEENRDHDQAEKYYDSALQACVESLDRNLQAAAHEQFGAFCERRNLKEEATYHYETRLKLVEISGDQEARIAACRPLVAMFLRRGAVEQQEGNMMGAKVLYERAVTISKACKDPGSEAKAYSALGGITVLLGDMDKALDYQKRFLVVCKDSNNIEQQSKASMQVAQLQHQMGHHDEAVQSLKEALEIAQESNNLRDICTACRQLGECYKSIGDSINAVHFFRQTFKVARDIGDEKLIESARAMLGFSLGEHYFNAAGSGEGFLSVACNDIAAQLDWLSSGVL